GRPLHAARQPDLPLDLRPGPRPVPPAPRTVRAPHTWRRCSGPPARRADAPRLTARRPARTRPRQGARMNTPDTPVLLSGVTVVDPLAGDLDDAALLIGNDGRVAALGSREDVLA